MMRRTGNSGSRTMRAARRRVSAAARVALSALGMWIGGGFVSPAAAQTPTGGIHGENDTTVTVKAPGADDAAPAAISMFGDPPPATSGSGATPVRRHGGSAATRAPTGTAGGTDAGNWLRTVLSLGAVTGLILLLAWGYRGVMRSTGAAWLGRSRQPAVLDVLARTSLTPKLGICLVRVGPRMVLVGVGADQLTALDVIDDADLTAKLAGRIATPAAEHADARDAAQSATARDFQQLLAQESEDSLNASADREPESPDGVRLLQLRGQLSGALRRLRAAAGRA